ncbi:hypothetical protein AVEN_212523-1 [Araneus ventricosus]|uniref:Uncharacterized protein n=1 Tax=Araneus ventricosus TaxID=182803 RepID=A0A4Y2TUD2_ARAVE|nr:hypothetical protein AVEN_212523-1 [Araneus ventricosus]
MDCSQSSTTRNQLLHPFSLGYHASAQKGVIAPVGNLTLNAQKFAITAKGKGCTNSPGVDSVITNTSAQEVKIDIRMEEIISDVDLEEKCQT